MRFADRFLCFESAEPKVRRRAILWPVFVWHVIYPTPARTDLNIFQRTILRLARAGCVGVGEQAELMGLSRDLVAFIAEKELGPRMLLDASGRPTAKGIAALKGQDDGGNSLQVGYAFQDAVTGTLMPRFSQTLPEIEAEDDGPEAWPRFVLSRETGQEVRPFCVTTSHKPAAPSAQRLLDAYNTYRFHHRQREVGEIGDSIEDNATVRIRSIEALGAEPQAMLMLIWVQADEDSGWQMRDPFQVLDLAPWLRRQMEAALPTTSGLNKVLDSVIVAEARTASTDHEHAERFARVRLEMLSRQWVGAVPAVAGQMEIVLRRSYQVSGAATPLPENLDSLFIETQKLCEAVLKWCLNEWPVDRRRLPESGEMRRKDAAWWQDFYSKLGLPCLTDSAIRRLAQQKWADIEAALRNGKRSLKALAAAGVLSSLDHADHPFGKLTAQELALDKLFQLADDRNSAGHFSGVLVSPEAVRDASDFVVGWTDRLIEAGRNR